MSSALYLLPAGEKFALFSYRDVSFNRLVLHINRHIISRIVFTIDMSLLLIHTEVICIELLDVTVVAYKISLRNNQLFQLIVSVFKLIWQSDFSVFIACKDIVAAIAGIRSIGQIPTVILVFFFAV